MSIRDPDPVGSRSTPSLGRRDRRRAAGAGGRGNPFTDGATYVARVPTQPYGPIPMVQGTRRRSVRWGSAPQVGPPPAVVPVVAGVVLGAVLLAACSGLAPGASGPIRITSTPAPSDVGALMPSAEDPIISAWFAAQRAFENAVRTADAGAPELTATMVAPQLSWDQSLMTLIRSAGDVASGPVDLGVPRIVARGPQMATVRSCVHDSEVVMSAATDQPVAGVLGQVDFELFTSTMQRTDSGWKLADQVVEVGPCHGS